MLTILAWMVFVLSSAWCAAMLAVIVWALGSRKAQFTDPTHTILLSLGSIGVWTASGIYIFGV